MKINASFGETNKTELVVNLREIFETTQNPCKDGIITHHLRTNKENLLAHYKGEKLLDDEYAVFSILMKPCYRETNKITAIVLLTELKWHGSHTSYKRLRKSLRKLGQGTLCFERLPDEKKDDRGGFSIINLLSYLVWTAKDDTIQFYIDKRIATLFKNNRIEPLKIFPTFPSSES